MRLEARAWDAYTLNPNPSPLSLRLSTLTAKPYPLAPKA